MSDVEITVAEVSGTLRGLRNLIRVAGDPLKIAVEVPNSPDCVLVEIREVDFDELDVTTCGIPTQFCRLGGDLIGLWPTPHVDMVVKIKSEIGNRRAG